MKREELLQTAASITKGARQEHYGSPEDNFKNIADYWQLYLSQRFEGAEGDLTATDVAAMMILMKLARIVHDPHHDDSWIDIAGYAACGSQCAEVNNG